MITFVVQVKTYIHDASTRRIRAVNNQTIPVLSLSDATVVAEALEAATSDDGQTQVNRKCIKSIVVYTEAGRITIPTDAIGDVIEQLTKADVEIREGKMYGGKRRAV